MQFLCVQVGSRNIKLAYVPNVGSPTEAPQTCLMAPQTVLIYQSPALGEWFASLLNGLTPKIATYRPSRVVPTKGE